jgi:hypothetical protein
MRSHARNRPGDADLRTGEALDLGRRQLADELDDDLVHRPDPCSSTTDHHATHRTGTGLLVSMCRMHNHDGRSASGWCATLRVARRAARPSVAHRPVGLVFTSGLSSPPWCP